MFKYHTWCLKHTRVITAVVLDNKKRQKTPSQPCDPEGRKLEAEYLIWCLKWTSNEKQRWKHSADVGLTPPTVSEQPASSYNSSKRVTSSDKFHHSLKNKFETDDTVAKKLETDSAHRGRRAAATVYQTMWGENNLLEITGGSFVCRRMQNDSQTNVCISPTWPQYNVQTG